MNLVQRVKAQTNNENKHVLNGSTVVIKIIKFESAKSFSETRLLEKQMCTITIISENNLYRTSNLKRTFDLIIFCHNGHKYKSY